MPFFGIIFIYNYCININFNIVDANISHSRIILKNDRAECFCDIRMVHSAVGNCGGSRKKPAARFCPAAAQKHFIF